MKSSFKSTIQKYIILKIGSEEWKPGEIIPSENGLAIKFKCSRLTVRSALQNLVNSGILSVKKGLGYSVPLIDDSVLLASFSKKKGCDQIVTNFMDSNNDIKEAFTWSDDDKIICIKKKYFRNSRLIATQITFLNKNLIWDKNEKLLNGSLTIFLNKQGSAIKRSDITIKKASPVWNTILNEGKKMGWNQTPFVEIIRSYTAEGWIEKTVRVTTPEELNITFTQNNYL